MSTLTTLNFVAGSVVETQLTGTDPSNWAPGTNMVGSGSMVTTLGSQYKRMGTLNQGVIPAGAIVDHIDVHITHASVLTGTPGVHMIQFEIDSGVTEFPIDYDGHPGGAFPGGSVSWSIANALGTGLGATIEDVMALKFGIRVRMDASGSPPPYTVAYTISAITVDITWDTGSYTLPTVTEPSLPPGTPYTESGVPHTMPWPDATLNPCGHTVVYHYPDSFITIDGVVTPLGPLTVDCFTLPYNGPPTPTSHPGGFYYPSAPTPAWTPGSPTQYGWYWSFEGFAGAGHVTIGGRPAIPRSFDELAIFVAGGAGYMGGFPGGAVTYHNRLIYASAGTPAIRVFDGQSDREIVKIPATSSGAAPIAIMSMMVAAGSIFIATLDSGTTSANFAGRVFRFDPTTLKLEPMGAGFSGGEVPYALCWHMGRLWVGTNKSSGAGGKVYYLRPDIDTAWTADYTLATSSAGGALSMASYHGKLYVGCDAAAGTFAKVIVRDAAGAYTTARTGAGGTARVNNGFPYLCVFDDRLYASYWNEDTAHISYIDSYDGTTWGLSYTGAGDSLRPFLAMFVENNLLYIYGGGFGLVASLTTLDTSDTPTELTAFLLGDTTGIPMFGVVVL